MSRPPTAPPRPRWEPSPLDLLGSWRLERRIDDHRADEVLTVEGALTLTAEGDDTVRWAEAGRLHRPGHPTTEVTRRLSVVRREGGWWVVFDHGGDFHPWAVGVEVEHPCGADVYRGLVAADSPAAWTITWWVSGPHKDYTMRSELTRRTAD